MVMTEFVCICGSVCTLNSLKLMVLTKPHTLLKTDMTETNLLKITNYKKNKATELCLCHTLTI